MDLQQLIEKYIEECPFAVLMQVAIRATMADELDDVFERQRSQQYQGEMVFSEFAFAVADVSLELAGNLNQAYRSRKKDLGVVRSSFYDKVNAMELPISEGVVRRSARRAVEIMDELECPAWEILPGYRVFAIDGNHLPESDKRLEPLRDAYDAPLPGTVVARFDLQRQVFDRAYLLEDAHAQESTTMDRVIDDLQEGDCLVADRHYCVIPSLKRIDDAKAAFVIRQHGRFQGILVGDRRFVGTIATGKVYEQEILTTDGAFSMRRITLELDKPTRDGDTVIHILTNLPASVDARRVAEVYGFRWEEETGFYYLTTTLTCESPSLGKPRAALFLFSMAMLAFNIRQAMFAALYAEHDEEAVDEVSHYHVAVEVSRYTDGMLIALGEEFWRSWIPTDPAEAARRLREIARTINLRDYRKSRRGPKKPKDSLKRTRPKTHLSTAKALAAAQ